MVFRNIFCREMSLDFPASAEGDFDADDDANTWEAGVDAPEKPTQNIIKGVSSDWSDDVSHDKYYYSKAVQDVLFDTEFRKEGLIPWRPSSYSLAQQHKRERPSAWADPRTNPHRIGKEKPANIFAGTDPTKDDYREDEDWYTYDQRTKALQAMVAQAQSKPHHPIAGVHRPWAYTFALHVYRR